jgi:hypothetical protein
MSAGRLWHITLLSSALLTAASAADAEEPLFPFVISFDAPQNVTNVADWLPRPAGARGFVEAKQGSLCTDAGPIRFWATNSCFEASFPTHEQAERVAARFARFGINCVRMHHMDSRSIWGHSRDKLTIDPEQLERLDYFIYQLKLHGVYTDLNLHVSRWFGKSEGFSAQEQRPQYDKGLDNFEPRMIELQKKYARDLLTHVNAYTKTAYINEPAVAFVEINNENAIFAQWSGNHLDNLPEPYATTYRKLWNAWLRKKYETTDRLRHAWNVGDQPLGAEMLSNGDFGKPLNNGWKIEADSKTQCEQSLEPGGPEGQRLLRLVVVRQGESAWHPQLSQSGLAVHKGAVYTLHFSLRCDQKQSVGFNCMMGHEPWQRLGLSATVDAGPAWQQFQRTFVVERDDSNARITFSGLKPATYELAAVSLRPGGIMGLAKGQRLEDESVPVLQHGELSTTDTARHDFVDFLYDTERDYWWGMYHFLKDELHVRPLVSGTQLGYSPVRIQAGLDYLDAHAYWNHPHFPGRPWDPKDWTVRNVALVNSPGGTLASLAARRVAGKPFTVSEYNHPDPIQYAAEGFPMIAAFGAFQSWDAIFTFAYGHNTEFEPRKITGYFDVKGNTPRLAHMPACAAMFLRGDVKPARATLGWDLSAEKERANLYEALSARKLDAIDFGLDERLALLHALAMDAGKGAVGAAPADVASFDKERKQFVSDTGQLRWDVQEKGAGYFIVDTPRSKLFTGFVRGRTFDLGNVRLSVGSTRLDWATISMVAIDGDGFDKPGHVLIAATGMTQNEGAKLRHVTDDKITLDNQWGSEPVLCEGIAAEISLPVADRQVRFYPLDESGNRRDAIAAIQEKGKTVLKLDPQQKTVWYEVEVR